MGKAQIKSKSRVRSFGEVFTSEREVKAMCDLIPENVWKDVGSKFLEPCCGNGNFIVEILRRKLKQCRCAEDVLTAYDSIWGIDIQQDNCAETVRRMLDMCPVGIDKSKIRIHIICGDSLAIMKLWADEENEKEETE